MSQVNSVMAAAFTKAGVTPICPYCRKPSLEVTGQVIYPHRKDLYAKRFFLCAPCDAYVGCHEKTGMPLGRLANKELRAAKVMAHGAFDPIWQNNRMNRTGAYRWLRTKMGLTTEQCHIGEFDVEQCREVIKHSRTYFGGENG